MKKLVLSLLMSFGLVAGAAANEGGYGWDKFPVEKMSDMAALQHGAKLFVNYCLNCHGASMMRYNRLRDLALTDDQIRQNLLFTADKVGETMTIAMPPKDAKTFFGAMPPDLSVIARARGNDWLYTYLRTFYRDDTRATGWNNLVFPAVGMPHVLWELQGQRTAKFAEVEEHGQKVHKFAGFEQVTPGKLSTQEYDQAAADIVNYLNWMAEPAQSHRKRLGVWVLLFLGVFTVFAWRLNAAFWKDVK